MKRLDVNLKSDGERSLKVLAAVGKVNEENVVGLLSGWMIKAKLWSKLIRSKYVYYISATLLKLHSFIPQQLI